MGREKSAKRGLASELRRRRVLPVAAAYAVAAWALVEASSLLLDTFEAPGIVLRVIIIFAVAGFPVAIALAWVFDISAEGIVRTDERDDTVAREESASGASRKLKQIEVVLLSYLPIQGAASLDPEDLLELHDAFDDNIGSIIREYGGAQVAETGLEFKAIFGFRKMGRTALQQAIDCGKALVSSACDIRAELASKDMTLPRVGLHLGHILVPRAGSMRKGLPADVVLGQAGRLVARIAHAAPPGQVLVSAEIAERLTETGGEQRLAPLQYEGTGDATSVYVIGPASD